MESHDVTLDECVRVFDRVTDAGLCCQMADATGLGPLAWGLVEDIEGLLEFCDIFEIAADKMEVWIFFEKRVPFFFQGGVVVWVEVVEADDGVTSLKEGLCSMETDEAGGTGDEDVHEGTIGPTLSEVEGLYTSGSE